MLILIYYYKNLLIDFIIRLLILINLKIKNHNIILVIINYLTQILYYNLLKVTINIIKLAKVF